MGVSAFLTSPQTPQPYPTALGGPLGEQEAPRCTWTKTGVLRQQSGLGSLPSDFPEDRSPPQVSRGTHPASVYTALGCCALSEAAFPSCPFSPTAMHPRTLTISLLSVLRYTTFL